ncbi:hypothetical protein GOODEAATRI_013461, partial [Goodea atripinnis]
AWAGSADPSEAGVIGCGGMSKNLTTQDSLGRFACAEWALHRGKLPVPRCCS